MTNSTSSVDRRSVGRPPKPVKTILMSLKLAPGVHQRFKLAAVQEGLTMGELLAKLLDLREDRLRRQRAAQASPLHPAEED